MLTRKTARNQVTIPKQLLSQLPATDYFDAEVVGDALVLKPVKVVAMLDINRVRSRLRRARVSPGEIGRAVRWARRKE